jgi:excisionase family DNA binding protein
LVVLSFQTQSVSDPARRHATEAPQSRILLFSLRIWKFFVERESMPSAANRSTYVPNNISSYRKPPASVSGNSNPNSMEPSSPVDKPQHTTADTRGVPSRMIDFPVQEHLLNAREVAARLGVSERWVRDHTTRRSPRIRGVKLGTLMRYRCADVEEFMERLTTSRSSFQRQFGG